MSTRIKEGTGATYRKLGHLRTKKVSGADLSGYSFRDPYPAFSTAISVHFAVAGTSGDSAPQNPLACRPDAVAMLFWALLSSGQINMRKIDGWQTLAIKPIDHPIDLAA